MENKILKVQMLGGFELRYGEETVILERSNSTKASQLLQYFLYNRDKKITRNELLKILYSKEDVINPVNNLKVTIFRLRRLLLASGLPEDEYISFKGGVYYWGSKIKIEIDSYLFEELTIKSRKPELIKSEKIDILKKAVSIYSGEFLPMISGEDWVVVENICYKKLYIECITKLCELFNGISEYNKSVSICDKAINIYKYDEEIYLIKLYSMLKMKHYKEAATVYDSMAKLFFENLGVSPSNEMECFYQKICDAVDNEVLSLFDIKKNLIEISNIEGAYYCNYVTFIDSYHIISRIVERFGQSAYLMLCTFVDNNHEVDNNNFNKKLHEASEKLHIAINASLRKGDVYTRYNKCQLLVLLIGINQEDCMLVTNRINRRFNSGFNLKGIRLDYNVISAADIDFRNNEYGYTSKDEK